MKNLYITKTSHEPRQGQLINEDEQDVQQMQLSI